jgi:hypothetical protein
MGDSPCGYRLEEFAMRTFLKQRNAIDRSIAQFGGNLPGNFGFFDRCLQSPYNMSYYTMTLGVSDLRVPLGFCLPQECQQADLDRVSKFVVGVSPDLGAAITKSYKSPIADFLPYENVQFIKYHKDDPWVSHFTGFSVGLAILTVIMIGLGAVSLVKGLRGKRKLEVAYGEITPKESLESSDGCEEGSKRNFWDCFDPVLNFKLLGSRKNWSTMEVAIDLGKVVGIWAVVCVRTLVYKLVVARSILDVRQIYRVAVMPIFFLSMACTWLPDLFLL